MSRKEKLLQKGRRNPGSLRFSELCKLAEWSGYKLRGVRGSHYSYRQPGRRNMNFQPDRSGYAKPYQVRQLLSELDGGSN